MKHTLRLPCLFLPALLAAGTLSLPLRAADTVVDLRHFWSDSADGPWAPVPPDVMSVAKDGSVKIASGAARKFFRVGLNEGAGRGSLPAVPFNSLGDDLQKRALRHLEAIRSGEGAEEEEAHWRGATIAPLAVPVFSPWNTGEEPDALELKIVPPAAPAPVPGALPSPTEPAREDAGFLMLGVSDDMPSLVEFSTEGDTMTERLLARCGGERPVTRVIRYAPTYIVAEDSTGEAIGSLGHYPVIRTDKEYLAHAVRHSYHGTDESPARIPAFDPQPEPPFYATYREFRAAYLASDYLAERRKQRRELFAFDRLAEELRAPGVTLVTGERTTLLPGSVFTEFLLDSEEERAAPADVTLPRGGGVEILAKTPGSWRLTLRGADGSLTRQMINITPRSGSPAPDDNEPKLVSKTWNAINSADQPRYYQVKSTTIPGSNYDWCPVVGCGPVAMQMLFSWWDRTKGVTSLFYARGSSNVNYIRETMHAADAPLESSANDSLLMRWYEFWHDECDVICAFGSGATPPENMGDAFYNYVGSHASLITGLGVGATGPLIGYECHWEADIISDDWDESGIAVAEEIKKGRPGVVLYYELMHYMMAYRYKRWRYEFPGSPLQMGWYRLFKCNMGWGDDFHWVNAYDIDGCWTGRFWRKNLPPKPN